MRLLSLAGIVCLAWGGLAGLCSAQPITIAEEGKSDYSIVLPSAAPSSVTEAAEELQQDIALATGVKLSILKDASPVTGSFISLGETKQAAAAGFSSKEMKEEAYRIVTRGGNLYIFGPDTPDDGWTPDGGMSNGTACGVYTFLENELGVRWLMPGDFGRDVPVRSTFKVEEMDRTDAPLFNYRRLSHSYTYTTADQLRKAIEWLHHQRIGGSGGGGLITFGGSTQLSTDHNWWRAMNDEKSGDVHSEAIKAIYKAHPDWFAMNAEGKRPPPANKYAKLETTNPGLVAWFAGQAVKFIKASKRPLMFSLSPSDGRGWSQSPQSKALYDPIPQSVSDPEASSGRPAMSSLILKWYHDVSQAVAKQCPDCRLGGYIYADYIYPPTKFQMKLPSNFTPMLAASFNYGYGLYLPATQAKFQEIMDAWGKVAPANWYYYDLPTQLLRQYAGDIGDGSPPVNFPGSTGIVMPAAPDMLNTIFKTLLRVHIKGSMLYGLPSWSSSAMSNYMMAQMEWNPKLDAHEVQRDWLTRAYGPQAGAVMEQFYSELNGWFADYYRQGKAMSYHLTLTMLRDLYAAHYPQMEKQFLEAQGKKMTPVQARRLQLIGDNLIVLQWRLRNAGFLPANFASQLKRSDEQVTTLLAQPNADFPMFPGAVETEVVAWNRPRSVAWKVRWEASQADVGNKLPPKLEGDTIVLYAARDGEIRITPRLVKQGAYFASYAIRDGSGAKVAAGVLNKGTPIVVPAKADSAYYLTMPARKGVNYVLEVADAATAQGGYDAKTKTLVLSGKPAAVSVFHVAGRAPIGVSQEQGLVKIQKPFAGADQVARLLESGNYSEARVLASLAEDWRFSPDPKDELLKKNVTDLKFNDSTWKMISSLNWWQMQGFADYHGPAWYRIKFTIPPRKEGEQTRVYFGSVDGNAVVYLNGHKLSEHKLGPNFEGWNKPFSTHVPASLWKDGENVLAVQVFSKSAQSASGITGGVAVIGRIPKK